MLIDGIGTNGVSLRAVLLRALRRKCPQCGVGRLLESYLRPVSECEACGERFGHIRSDDAAPWLTILIVGHIVGALILATETSTTLPDWVLVLLFPLVAVGLSLLVLPIAKSFFVAVIWFTRSPGSER